jgi:hypothetical protein
MWSVTTAVTGQLEPLGERDKTARNYTKQPHWALHTHTAASTDVQYKRCIVGNSITCAIYCNIRTAATLETVEAWFVSGI